MEQALFINNRKFHSNLTPDTNLNQPKSLKKYLRINNPTFKSDNVGSTLAYYGEEKVRFSKNDLYDSLNKKGFANSRPHKKNYQQIDIATQQFLGKKQEGNTKNSYEQYINNSEIRISNPELKDSKVLNPTLKQRSKSVAIMKLYMNNDEGVFAKQSKQFNIISGQAQKQTQLRKYPKLSTQYKNNLNSLFPLG